MDETTNHPATTLVDWGLTCGWYMSIAGFVFFAAVVIMAASGVIPEPAGLSIQSGALKITLPAGDAIGSLWPAQLLMLNLPILALGIFVLYRLRLVWREVRGGRPFAMANAQRLSSIGWALLVKAAVQTAANLAFAATVHNRWHPAGVDIEVVAALDGGSAFIGLLVLALAEIFRHGAALREDADLTV